jgi:hypothetical protein
MVRKQYLRWVIVSGLVGVLVSVVLLSSIGPRVARSLGCEPYELMLAVWPSSMWLLATAGQEDTLSGYWIVAQAVLANFLLYAVGGLVLCWLKRLAEKVVRRRSLERRLAPGK